MRSCSQRLDEFCHKWGDPSYIMTITLPGPPSGFCWCTGVKFTDSNGVVVAAPLSGGSGATYLGQAGTPITLTASTTGTETATFQCGPTAQCPSVNMTITKNGEQVASQNGVVGAFSSGVL